MKKTYLMPSTKWMKVQTEQLLSLSIAIDHSIKVDDSNDVMSNSVPLINE